MNNSYKANLKATESTINFIYPANYATERSVSSQMLGTFRNSDFSGTPCYVTIPWGTMYASQQNSLPRKGIGVSVAAPGEHTTIPLMYSCLNYTSIVRNNFPLANRNLPRTITSSENS